MSYTISKERFNSQEAVSKLIKEATSKGKEKIVLEGLYSSAKAFAISAAATQGIHIVLLNNREDAVYCSGDLYKLIDINRVFFFPPLKFFHVKMQKKIVHIKFKELLLLMQLKILQREILLMKIFY